MVTLCTKMINSNMQSEHIVPISEVQGPHCPPWLQQPNQKRRLPFPQLPSMGRSMRVVTMHWKLKLTGINSNVPVKLSSGGSSDQTDSGSKTNTLVPSSTIVLGKRQIPGTFLSQSSSLTSLVINWVLSPQLHTSSLDFSSRPQSQISTPHL